MLNQFDLNLPSYFEKLKTAFWPGPISFICLDKEKKTHGFRFPDSNAALQLIEAAGGNIAGTSANLSGSASPLAPEDVVRDLGFKIDLLIDDGQQNIKKTPLFFCSESEKPQILREGCLADKVKEFIEALN